MNGFWIFMLKHFGIIPEEMSTEEYHKKVEEAFSK